MSMKYLGETLDIHGGGSDLIFPHHENEIAQSEGATGKQFVRYWMHNAMVNVNGNKMSKSLGNFTTTRDMLNKYPGETIRFFVLSSHYRSPVDFDERMLDSAQKSLQKVYNCISELRSPLLKAAEGQPTPEDAAALESIRLAHDQFIAAMDDDFNTPLAIASIFELTKGANFYLASPKPNREITDKFLAELLGLGKILNLFQANQDVEVTPEIRALLEERERARSEKNYARSDEIRKKLLGMGIVLEDRGGGEINLKRA
jgi:cysteinyl-tRNA synthetase